MHRGFIALISAIIISGILLTVIMAGSLTGFYSRFNVLDAESKERSRALADACVETLLLRLATGAGVAGVVAVDTDSCEIRVAATPGEYEVEAVYNDSHTNLLIAVDTDFVITSWQEVASL